MDATGVILGHDPAAQWLGARHFREVLDETWCERAPAGGRPNSLRADSPAVALWQCGAGRVW
jgi:hypothetical protein